MRYIKYSLLSLLLLLCPLVLIACGNSTPPENPSTPITSTGTTTFTKELSDCQTGYFVTNVVTTQAHVTVPSTHNGKQVIGIASGAFGNATSMTRATLPNSVVHIGESAFAGLPALERVALGNNVTYIGARAFSALTDTCVVDENWTGGPLQTINFPNSLEYLAPDALYSQFDVTINTRTVVWDMFVAQLYNEYLGQFQTYFAGSPFGSQFAEINLYWDPSLHSQGLEGAYDMAGNIFINLTLNNQMNRFTMNTKETILHEVRHFYQHAMATLVLDIAPHVGGLSAKIDSDYFYLADLWMYNFDNYISATPDSGDIILAYTAYYTQPVEVDANMFTSRFIGRNELYTIFYLFGNTDPNLFDYDCILTTTARMINFNLDRLPTTAQVNFGSFSTTNGLFTAFHDLQYSSCWLGFYSLLPENLKAEINKNYEDVETLAITVAVFMVLRLPDINFNQFNNFAEFAQSPQGVRYFEVDEFYFALPPSARAQVIHITNDRFEIMTAHLLVWIINSFPNVSQLGGLSFAAIVQLYPDLVPLLLAVIYTYEELTPSSQALVTNYDKADAILKHLYWLLS